MVLHLHDVKRVSPPDPREVLIDQAVADIEHDLELPLTLGQRISLTVILERLERDVRSLEGHFW